MIVGELVKPRKNVLGAYYISAYHNTDGQIFFFKNNKQVKHTDVYVYITNIKWGGTDYSMLLLGDQMVYLLCGEVDPI